MFRLAGLACVASLAWIGIGHLRVSRSSGGDMGAAEIVKRSVAANQRDWQAAPSFDCFERDRTSNKSVTYKLLMIDGSPFLLKIPGEHPGPAQEKDEERKVQREVAHRRAESGSDRASRIRDFNTERDRDRLMLEQLAEAFTFSLRGQQTLNGRGVYVIDAKPRPGYSPPNEHARALTGMQGTLWIDTATFNWVRVTATVTHPVSIYGFIATVEPGTMFDMEKAPVAGDIWQPTHFRQKANSRILRMISHSSDEDIRYWQYVKANNADPLNR
jgi:hypothetical protein